MILLTCASLPKAVGRDALFSMVSLLFPHPENKAYLEDISGRSDASSANESLFALILLYELILRLPYAAVIPALRFSRTPKGKPYLKDSNLKFSISHSKGVVVCALSDEGDIGVDAETANVSAERSMKIADRFFSDEEKELVRISPNQFKKIWCEKEARAKYYGFGLGKLLDSEKSNDKKHDAGNHSDGFIHRFYFNSVPIILCVKEKRAAIQFISAIENQ